MKSAPQYKRPESVLVVIHTRSGQVLLLERRSPRGFWQSVTGSLRWDETPRQAALRELREETGLDGHRYLIDCHHSERFPIIPPWRARYAPNIHLNREHLFLLPLPSRRIVRLSPHEHIASRWLPWQRAAAWASSWTNRAAIRRLMETIPCPHPSARGGAHRFSY